MPAHPETRIGHVHLKVTDLDRSVAFYRDVMGLEVMQTYGRQAAFLSAGGYHHHIGLNTWHSKDGPRADPRAPGLYHTAFVFPDRPALADALAGLRDTSPRFFSSYLFEAMLRARAGDDDGQVVELLLDAHRIAPSDVRPLLEAAPRLVQLGRALEAKDLVRELESLYPSHPDLARLRQLTGEGKPTSSSAGPSTAEED